MKTLFVIYFIGMLLTFIYYYRLSDRFSPEYFDQIAKDLYEKNEGLEYDSARRSVILSTALAILIWPTLPWYFCKAFFNGLKEELRRAKEQVNEEHGETDL